MIKKITLLSGCLFLLGLFLGRFPVRAQGTATDSSSVTQTLKNRIEQVLNGGDGASQTPTSDLSNIGWVGTLDKIVGSTIQVTTWAGAARIGELDKNATVTRQGKPISRDELELNSPVMAFGTLDQNSAYQIHTLTALTGNVYPDKRLTLIGTFTTLTTKILSLTSTGADAGTVLSIPVTTRTAFYDTLGQKIDKKTIKIGHQLIVVVPDQADPATASALRAFDLTLTPVSSTSAGVKLNL